MNLTLTLRKKITARIAYLNHIFGSGFFKPERTTPPNSEQLVSSSVMVNCCSQAKELVWISRMPAKRSSESLLLNRRQPPTVVKEASWESSWGKGEFSPLLFYPFTLHATNSYTTGATRSWTWFVVDSRKRADSRNASHLLSRPGNRWH